MLRRGSISKEWGSDLAYVIGLLASDGNLSSDGRHINLTSKDESVVLQTKEILRIGNKLSRKARVSGVEKKYFFLQFGSVDFYEFLFSVGLTPAKSKTIDPLNIPSEYFADFLRGCIDGDGCISETTHPESVHLQSRVSLCSASILFLEWLHNQIQDQFEIEGGWITTSERNHCSLLSYAKNDSIRILEEIYRKKDSYRLERKFSTAKKYLDGFAIV
jgi:hypothetical protein